MKLVPHLADKDSHQNIDAILQVHMIEHIIGKMNKNFSFTNFMGQSKI